MFTKIANLKALILYRLFIAANSDISVNHVCLFDGLLFFIYKRRFAPNIIKLVVKIFFRKVKGERVDKYLLRLEL